MSLPVGLLEKEIASFKRHAEGIAERIGQPVPEGYCFCYNESLDRVSLFLDYAAYDEKHVEGDKILTQWVNGKWEDK